MKTKTFHYTNEQMVKDLINLTPLEGCVLDAGSGEKIWYHNIKGSKEECELDRGCNFYEWITPVDWIIGNPPFHESWKFFEQASKIARKGIAFLINNQAFNSMTPRRFELLKKRGFYLNKMHIVSDARWFGRYYYLIFQKKKNDFMSWETKTYK